MSDTARFACESCGKKYPWKPQYSGKKVKCSCGAVMTAPTEPPAVDDDLYDFAEEPAPAKKPIAVANVALTAPPDGESLRPPDARGGVSPMMAYQSKQQEAASNRKKDFENQLGGETWRELYLPAGLLVAGLVLNVLLFAHSAGGWVSPKAVLLPLSISLIFNLVLSFGGILIVARIAEISFGHPGTAVLKMAACILLPSAIAGFAGNLIGDDSGFVNMMVRATLIMPLTIVALIVLFQLSLDEAFWVVAVIYIITDWVTKLLLVAILATGSTGGKGMSAVMGMGDMEEELPKSRSAWAVDEIQKNQTHDPFEYLKPGNRTLGSDFTPIDAVTFLNELKRAGATDLRLSSPFAYRGYTLLVGMPADKAAREKIIAFCKDKREEGGLRIDEPYYDEDKYIIIEFGHGMENATWPVGPDGKSIP